jgi:hypothetical protein
MSEEIKNVSRGLPILDLSHLDPIEGITEDNMQSAAAEQEIAVGVDLHEVKLPQPSSDGQLIIHDSAFNGSYVTKVYGLNKVTKIEDYAFSGCKSLGGKIWIDHCTEMGEGAFTICHSINEVVLSPNLEVVPNHCFNDCYNIQKVYNLNKVKTIGEQAFYCCGALSGKIWIDSCTSLGSGAFEACGGEDYDPIEIVLSPNLVSIPNSCFFNSNITRIYNLNKIHTIGTYALSNTLIMDKIWIDRCTSVGADAFSECGRLMEIVLNPGGCQLGSSCFNKSMLQNVHNLNKATKIGSNAFYETNLFGKLWIDHCTELGEGVFVDLELESIVILQSTYDKYVKGSESSYAGSWVDWIMVS